jgi:hypothetical protein
MKNKQKGLAPFSMAVWLDRDTGKWHWSIHEFDVIIKDGSASRLSIAIEQARRETEKYYE